MSDEPVEDLEQADVDALGRSYLDGLCRLAPSAARVCDKQLPNFERLGILAAILPRARIIHTRRDPLDTCVSCYVNRFPVGTPAVFGDLRALGMYYNDYLALMEHWRAVLDEPMFELDYKSSFRTWRVSSVACWSSAVSTGTTGACASSSRIARCSRSAATR